MNSTSCRQSGEPILGESMKKAVIWFSPFLLFSIILLSGGRGLPKDPLRLIPLLFTVILVNLLFFLAPLWAVGAIAGLAVLVRPRTAGRPARDSLAAVAGLALGVQLAVALATHGQQGTARDWDIARWVALMVRMGGGEE